MDKTVKVSLYLRSICMPPYIGYTTSDEPRTINLLAFIRMKAAKKMLKDPTCFEKAVKALWKKGRRQNLTRIFGHE